jgi:trk system potassium uptake protein
VIYQEWYSALGFLISALITAGLGASLYYGFCCAAEPLRSNAIVITAFGWLMVSVLGGLPFVVIAWITPADVMQHFIPAGASYTTSSLLVFRNPLHAVFESMSATTTTGLTMAVHEPSIGKGLLFYRSISNWVGGAGFIVMALAIFKQVPGRTALLLYSSESTGQKLKYSVIETAKAIWKVYLYVTLFLIFYLIIGTYLILPDYPLSENIFDSVNHAMNGQSTGGFSTLDDSIAGYMSPAMDMLYLLPMILGSFSFPFYFRVIYKKQFNEFWKDIQTRSLLIAFVFGSLIMSVLLIHANGVPNPTREGIFQFVSALSTTGWQTSNVATWDNLSVLFIVVAMIIGGAAGSTVGGIKIIRALLIRKGIIWQVNKVFLSDRAVETITFNGKTMLPEEMNRELSAATTLLLLYILMIMASTIVASILTGDNFTISDALFEAASAQGTVGLSTGITDPSMNPIVETIYIIQMWAGRLEVLPVLALIRVIFWRQRPNFI